MRCSRQPLRGLSPSVLRKTPPPQSRCSSSGAYTTCDPSVTPLRRVHSTSRASSPSMMVPLSPAQERCALMPLSTPTSRASSASRATPTPQFGAAVSEAHDAFHAALKTKTSNMCNAMATATATVAAAATTAAVDQAPFPHGSSLLRRNRFHRWAESSKKRHQQHLGREELAGQEGKENRRINSCSPVVSAGRKLSNVFDAHVSNQFSSLAVEGEHASAEEHVATQQKTVASTIEEPEEVKPIQTPTAKRRPLSTVHPAFGTSAEEKQPHELFDGAVSVSGFFLAVDPNLSVPSLPPRFKGMFKSTSSSSEDPLPSPASANRMNPNAQLTINDQHGNFSRARYRCDLTTEGGVKVEALLRFQLGWITPKCTFDKFPEVIHLGKGLDVSIPFVFHFTTVQILDGPNGKPTGSRLCFSGTPMFGLSFGYSTISGGKLVLNNSRKIDPQTETKYHFIGVRKGEGRSGGMQHKSVAAYRVASILSRLAARSQNGERLAAAASRLYRMAYDSLSSFRHLHYRQVGIVAFKCLVYLLCLVAATIPSIIADFKLRMLQLLLPEQLVELTAEYLV